MKNSNKVNRALVAKKNFLQVNRALVAKKNFLQVNRALVAKKNFLLLNQSFGTVGSPNQTGETLTRENRIGLMSYLRLTLMLLFAVLVMSMANIGMAWGAEYALVSNPTGTPALTTNFRYGNLTLNKSTAATIDGIAFKKGIGFGSSLSSISGKEAGDNNIMYDVKTTSTKFTVYVSGGTGTLYFSKIAEGATSTTVENKTISSNPQKIEFTLSSTTNTCVGFSVSSTSMYIYQIIAEETGTAHKQAGEAGYQLNLNKGRYAGNKASSNSGKSGSIDNVEFATYDKIVCTSSTAIQLEKNSADTYVKFTTGASAVNLKVTFSAGSLIVNTTKSTSGGTSLTSNTAQALAASTTYWIISTHVSNRASITKIAFEAASGVTNPSFSPATESSLVKSTGTVTLTSSGNTVYYKWSQTNNQYASGDGATLAGAADGSGTSPVNATAPSTAGTWYLYAVAKNGGDYSDVVKATYTITNPTYTVSYNLNGGKYNGSDDAPTQEAVESGTNITMPVLAPTKADYAFVGWRCSVNSADYMPSASYTMTAANTTFTAQWATACFEVPDARKNSNPAATITASMLKGNKIAGGTLTWESASDYSGNGDHGLILNEDGEQIVVTLNEGAFVAGSIITITTHGNSGTSKTCGVKVSGNNMTPATYSTESTGYRPFSQTYVVQAGDGIVGTNTFAIKRYNSNQVYIYSITVSGCGAASCTAPNHVDVTGRWDRFAGETISLTATAYSSEGTGSPIAAGSITGYQWEKLVGTTWTALSNGTTDGVTTSGATTANLQIANCKATNSGKYRCVVSTGATCSTASATATDGTQGLGVKVFMLECYNDGTKTCSFTRTGDTQTGTATLTLAANTAYTFKFHVDNVYYGNNASINEDITNYVFCNSDNGGNCAVNFTINSGLGGTFTLGIDYSTGGNSNVEGEPELSVTYPRKTVYLDPGVWKTPSDGEKFAYNYYRDGGSGGWTDFLAEDDCGMYADIPQWNGVILIPCRLKNTTVSPGSWDDRWNQTNDITVTSNDYVTITGWNASDFTYTTYSTPTYTISYAKGTPAASIDGSKADETKTCGVDFTLPNSAVFTRTGYTQTGWTTSDGGAQEYALGGTYTTNEDKTFYPVWTVNNYDLTWNLDGGTTTSEGTGIGSGVSSNTTTSQAFGTALTAPTVTKTGYNFSAWSPTVAGTMPAANTTYTATWAVKTTTITLEAGEGGTDGSATATYGTSTITDYVAATRTGYTLGNYYKDDGDHNILTKEGTLNTGNKGSLIVDSKWASEDAAVTLYAQWSATSYTLSYDLAGGSVASPNPTSYTIESSAITLNNPTKTGYTFAGWTGTGLAEATTTVTIAAGSTGNRSYTATWTAIVPSSVSLNKSSTTITVGGTETLTATISPAVVADNTITWSTSDADVATVDGGVVTAVAAGTATITATTVNGKTATCEVTVAAAVTYTVTYVYNDADGGSRPASATGASVTLPEPTKTGYTLDGWYTTAGAKVDDGGETYSPTADITLYARWTETCSGGGGGDPIVIKLFDGSTDDDFAASPITVSGVSLAYTAYDKPAEASDVSSKTNNVNSKNYAKGYQFSTSEINKGANRKCLSFTVPSGYTATFTHAFGASGNSRVIRLGSSLVTTDEDENYIATLVTVPSSGGSGGIWGGTYSSSLSAGTYFITGTGGGWQIVELIFTLTPTGSPSACNKVLYHGNGAESGYIYDPTVYDDGDDPVVLGNTTGTNGVAFVKDGYVFQGWATSAGGSVAYSAGDEIENIDDDVNLYAVWEEEGSGYTVTYNGSSNDGGIVPTDASSPYIEGATVTVLGNTGSLTRTISDDAATFYGWNTNSNMYGGTHYDAGATFAMPSSNVILYAVWGYSITWNLNDGEWVDYTAPTHYIYGQGLALPNATKISKAGNTFDHWELEYDHSTITSIATDATGNVQLNAIWSPTCSAVAAPTALTCSAHTSSSLTFTWTKAANASTYTATLYSDAGCTSQVASQDLGDENTVTFGTSLSAETTYYCKVQSHGDGSTYCAAGGTTSAASGTTDAVPAGHTVTYNYNGGTGTPASATGASVTLPTPTRTGYELDGWYATDGTKAGIGGATYEPEADITLYAKWYATCAAGGSTDVYNGENVAKGSTTASGWTINNSSNMTLTSGSSDGYSYWYLASSSTNYVQFDGSASLVAGDQIKIQWTHIVGNKDLTLTINGSGASLTSGGHVTTANTKMEAVYDVTSAKTVTSIKLNSSGSGGCKIYQVTLVTATGGTCYHVTYDGNGATSGFVNDTTAYKSGDEVTVLANGGRYPYVNGILAIKGWADSDAKADAGTVDYAPGAKFTITADKTLYAVWSNEYAITYNLNGASWAGGYSAPAQYTYGTGATLPVAGNMTNTGYTFGGWYDNSSLTGSAVTEIGTSDYGNKTFWAKWTENTYTVTYDKNGGSGDAMANTVGHYVRLSTNTYTAPSGKIFVEWNTNSTGTGDGYRGGEDIELEADMTLYAIWADDYTISWGIVQLAGVGAAVIPNLGGGNYTITASVSAWTGTLDASMISSETSGVTITNVAVSNGGSPKTITVTFAVGANVVGESIGLTLSVPAAGGYSAKSDTHPIAIDRCTGSGGGSDGVLFSAEFKDSGLGTSNICDAANDPYTFTTAELKSAPTGGSIKAYTTGDLNHLKYVDNGVYLKGANAVIEIDLNNEIRTNDLFEYVNVHSSNPNAYLRHTTAGNTTDQIVLTGYGSRDMKVMLPAAFDGKTKLFIVKNSTDFKLHKAAVVRPAFLMLLRDDTPTSETKLSGTDELTTSNYLSIMKGGQVFYTSPASGDVTITRNSSKNYLSLVKTTGYLMVDLDDPLQEDDVIGYDTYNGSSEIAFTTTTTRSTTIHTTSQLYTVDSSSPLKGQTTFYIWYNSSSTPVRGLQIARSGIAGGGGGTDKVTPTLTWDDDDIATTGVSKNTSDDGFIHTASQNTNSLGAITYSSNNTAVATVNATTGEVHLEGAAGEATITATIAASGCYNTASVSYVVTVVDDCDDVAGTITTEDLGCKGILLTVTGHTTTASTSYQWYKVGSPDEQVATGQDNYTTTTAGSYYVIVTNTGDRHCAKRSRNTVTVEAQAAATATKIVDSWYVKNGRRTPDVELVQTTNAESFTVTNKGTSAVIWNSDGTTTTGFGGCGFHMDENGIIYLNGTTAEDGSGDAPSGLTGGDNVTLTITAIGCGGNESKDITIHCQASTTRKSIAFVVDGTEKGTFAQANADHSTNSALFKFLDYGDDSNGAFDLTAQNIYSTTDEKAIREHFSQFDAIIITDDPNTKKNPANKSGDYYKNHGYVNAFGTMIDVRPILSMEAFVSRLTNWGAKGVAGDPSSPDPRQYKMRLQCKDHEIYSGLPAPAPGTHVWSEDIDGEEYRHVIMVDSTKSPYNGVAYNADTDDKPALQGFESEDMGNLLGLGLISDGNLHTGIERQEEPAARMMILGVQAKALPNALTEEGKKVIENALNYLLKTNMEEVDDCSNFFKGGTAGKERDWHTAANWAKATLPNYETKVRILAPCELSEPAHVAQVDIATSGTSSKIPGGTCSGSLTINPTGALVVGGKVRTADAPHFAANDLKPTTVNDLIINTNGSGQAALIFNNDEAETQATVNLYSLGRKEGEAYQFQYFAVPMEYVDVNPAFAGSGIYTYVWHENGGWERRGYYTELYAFEGVGITTKFNEASHNYTMSGNLTSTKEKVIALTNSGNEEDWKGDNIIGNSWMAPIDIASLKTAIGNDDNVDKAVYIYCTGNDGESVHSGSTEAAGQWLTIPIDASGWSGWKGLKVIPAMQAFLIHASAESSLTLNYNDLVRKTATANLNEKLRAPGRRMAHQNEFMGMRMRVTDSQTHTDLYLFEGEQFSEDYDNGWEAKFMEGDGRSAQFYAMSGENKMAVLATDELEGTPVGFTPGKESNYTISFFGDENGYYLNDIKLRNSVRITEGETYTFTFEEGDAANRFYISRQPLGVPEVATGVGEVPSDQVLSTKAKKIIYNEKMYILYNGRVFDGTGKVVK